MKLKKIFYFLKSLVTKKKLNLIKDQEKIFSDNQLNYIEGQKKLKKVLQNIVELLLRSLLKRLSAIIR